VKLRTRQVASKKKYWGCEAMADNVRLNGWHNGLQYGDGSGTGPFAVYKMHTTFTTGVDQISSSETQSSVDTSRHF
jgi:hypothetical protein